MTKGIAALIAAASDADLKDDATPVLHGMILDCIRLTSPVPLSVTAAEAAAAAASAVGATPATASPVPPIASRPPHGFSDLDNPPADVPGGVAGRGSPRGIGSAGGTSGGAGGAAVAAMMQDPRTDVIFSPLEAVAEHLRGRRATSPREITDAIVDGLSDVRKDVQAVATGLIE